MKYTIILLFLFINIYANALQDSGTNVIWNAIFENTTPQNSKITKSYCISHTPTVIITNIKQITSKNGVTALNNVTIRYFSYKSTTVNGLHFNVVDGELSGISNNKVWREPIKLYEQTLDEVGKTYTVWSTPSCKGIFTGYPTYIESITSQNNFR